MFTIIDKNDLWKTCNVWEVHFQSYFSYLYNISIQYNQYKIIFGKVYCNFHPTTDAKTFYVGNDFVLFVLETVYL